MNFVKKALLGLGFFAALGLSAAASATPFSITGGSFSTGTGYGTGDGQLDVTFTSLVAPTSFDLAVGQTASFLFGRVTLNESCINSGNGLVDFFACGLSGLGKDETNNLGVTANLTFASPLATTVSNVAIVGAFVGTVNGDNDVDYSIDFNPVTVNFGTSGAFVVDVGDFIFRGTGPISNGFNVTLTRAEVPEPATLGLLGLGLLGVATSRRKRAKNKIA
ncbi:PEP-CTERM protein-sorting domain-containing protein [Noviherbaspirillum humi]|uniref:PEP-CTERM protein-sorting domain-containing protein n=1 Tax=Noviherbaspirillum humi TaxID=1688639 RepID=A0A239H2P4_9BURK|nr:PEP-CTERM sorting domain-containing protein [Noviherbaspirillum humi]SNS75452.1 PEP-CTERM protein-sorting domain-containing protein [Noviherbaspirillum humi]